MLLVINSDPVSEKHISWFTRAGDKGNDIELYEIVERSYPHPQAPEYATVPVIEIKSVASFKRLSLQGATSVLLEASLNAITNDQRRGKENV